MILSIEYRLKLNLNKNYKTYSEERDPAMPKIKMNKKSKRNKGKMDIIAEDDDEFSDEFGAGEGDQLENSGQFDGGMQAKQRSKAQYASANKISRKRRSEQMASCSEENGP